MTLLSPRAQAANAAAIPQLVAEVYEAASTTDRSRLIAQLLRPLGLLSLVAVADGIFAKIRMRSGWQDLNIRLEDLQNVRAAHIVALVDHAQQVSVEAVDELARVLITSPLLTSSAAAMLLVSVLVNRAHSRESNSPASDSAECDSLGPDPLGSDSPGSHAFESSPLASDLIPPDALRSRTTAAEASWCPPL